MNGLKFRRQGPIGRYTVNFVCLEKTIIIGPDGGQHAQPTERDQDKERDNWFEGQGFKVLRFWDNEVLTDIDRVLEVIRENGSEHPPLNPLPSREGKTEAFLPSREGKYKVPTQKPKEPKFLR